MVIYYAAVENQYRAEQKHQFFRATFFSPSIPSNPVSLDILTLYFISLAPTTMVVSEPFYSLLFSASWLSCELCGLGADILPAPHKVLSYIGCSVNIWRLILSCDYSTRNENYCPISVNID